MSLTVAAVRPYIAKAVGVCNSDTRVITYLNRAIERLLPKGKWKGTIIRYRICTSSDCITWPRAIQTIEAFAVEGKPRKVRNDWFEFLESGQGVLNSQSNNGQQLVDRGEVATFADITAGAWGYIRIYTDLPEAEDAHLILIGYDENGNWIRSLEDDAYIDGVKVSLPTSAGNVITTQKFSRLVKVIKSATNGAVRLYEYLGGVNVRALAIYESDETLPAYRRSYVPGLSRVNANDSECPMASVEVMAKLRYYDVAQENDFLLISCRAALIQGVKAELALDKELIEKEALYEAKAVALLQEDLGNYIGDGPVLQMRVDKYVGAGDIEPVVGGTW